MKKKPCIIGIDFGTTSLSAVAVNTENMRIEKVFSRNTNAYVDTPDPLVREQSVSVLTELFHSLLNEVGAIPGVDIVGYGFTGQMHGIVGVNAGNEAVTNLVTWEDKSGDIILCDGESVLDKVRELSGERTISNGYGILTLYKWLKVEKRTDIAGFCTIADYFAGSLCGRIAMSPSMAHSVGLFDMDSDCWKKEAINRLGLPSEVFPEIVDESTVIGYTNGKAAGIPVVSAIGDNQASFLGGVLDKEKSALLNIGTGAQVSVVIDRKDKDIYSKYVDGFDTQFRPYDRDSLLIATGFVNGGTTYRVLFNFFEQTGRALFNLGSIDEGELWKNMEKAACEAKAKNSDLQVSPLLAGQRKDPGKRGEITNITSTNLLPGNLILGFLTGLAEYYKTGFFPEMSQKVEFVCGSGNGLKKNGLLVRIVEEVFGKPVYLTPFNEEASVGAALNAAKAVGIIRNDADCKRSLQKLFEKA